MHLKTKVFTTDLSACELSAFTAYKSKIFLHKIHVTCICILKKRTYLKLFSRTAHKLKCLHSWINGINDYLFHIVEFITLDNNHPPPHTRLHIIIFILRPDTLFIYFPTCYTWSKTDLLFKSKMYTCKSKTETSSPNFRWHIFKLCGSTIIEQCFVQRSSFQGSEPDTFYSAVSEDRLQRKASPSHCTVKFPHFVINF